jgi:hypothetical protein
MWEFYGVLRRPFGACGIYDVGIVNTQVKLLVGFQSLAHNAQLRVGRACEVETVGGLEIILASMQGCHMDKGFNPTQVTISPWKG